MTQIRSIAALGASLVFLSACATTPDPAKICTTEWIVPRATKAVDRIEDKTRSSIKRLASVSQTFAKGETPNAVQIFMMTRALSKLEKELTDGRGIRDLKTVARTCDDPDIVSDSLRNLMSKNGLSDSIIDRIEAFPIYRQILEDITDPAVADRI